EPPRSLSRDQPHGRHRALDGAALRLGRTALAPVLAAVSEIANEGVRGGGRDHRRAQQRRLMGDWDLRVFAERLSRLLLHRRRATDILARRSWVAHYIRIAHYRGLRRFPDRAVPLGDGAGMPPDSRLGIA